MIRKIIQINQDRCIGCGLCANACHEQAIIIENSKARLIRDDYCDGLGNCLPVCPTDAITFVLREADPYDQQAVEQNIRQKQQAQQAQPAHTCPGSLARPIPPAAPADSDPSVLQEPSHLAQWPIQIQLMPLQAPYYKNADLLIAADCTAFACGAFHQKFMKDHITIIGCPKLDPVDYSEKLTAILRKNDIKSVSILRMEVPCCGGLEFAAKKAILASGKFIPKTVTILSTDGKIK